MYNDINILCVEDDKVTLDVYESLFSLMFNEVFLAKNGKEGLEIFNNNKIDIIITDQNMPFMNGLQMSEKIREKDFTIPIIMVTALEDLDILRKSLDINITAFIKKPLRKDILLSKLDFISKSIIAERFLIKEQKKFIEYTKYQESLAYQKESKISKLYLDHNIKKYKLEYYYMPKDILAGDGFLVKNNIIFLIDAMGKGVSASITSVIATSFVDYLIDMYNSIEEIVFHFIEFIKKFLLEGEIVSCGFIEEKDGKLKYALFSMPPILAVKNGKLYKIKSNNFAINFNTQTFHTNTINDDFFKLLVYTDGLSEAKYNDTLYYKKMMEDFIISKNINEFIGKFKKNYIKIEDDITILFLKVDDE
ncbi:response regulator [Nautilia lithotrophica]